MTPTEATNRITEFVRQRELPRWWNMHGGFFVGLVAETIADVVSGVIAEVADDRLEFLEHAQKSEPSNTENVSDEFKSMVLEVMQQHGETLRRLAE